MTANHESVNEALALAVEGYNEAARPIEATRLARIAELLKPDASQYRTSGETYDHTHKLTQEDKGKA
jgi:hypothetical protein